MELTKPRSCTGPATPAEPITATITAAKPEPTSESPGDDPVQPVQLQPLYYDLLLWGRQLLFKQRLPGANLVRVRFFCVSCLCWQLLVWNLLEHILQYVLPNLSGTVATFAAVAAIAAIATITAAFISRAATTVSATITAASISKAATTISASETANAQQFDWQAVIADAAGDIALSKCRSFSGVSSKHCTGQLPGILSLTLRILQPGVGRLVQWQANIFDAR